jgi:hypothetical protein
LKVNCGAAVCTDPRGEKVAVDNLWLEYVQTGAALKIVVHSIDPPAGCGIAAASAAYGLIFEKSRAAGSVWRSPNP